MKQIYILGAAGSIGLQTIDIVKKNPDEFHIVGLSLGSNDQINDEILSSFSLSICALRTSDRISEYQQKYPATTFVHGDEGLLEVVRYPIKGLVINALSGSAGLIPTVEAIKSRKDIALANKETLVMAGDIIKKMLDNYQVKLFPIDSEHSALWQLIEHEPKDRIQKIIITASGGSFRELSRKELEKVTIDQALNHPNWKMGAKITIDSATMMNKGLEVIEAHHLFNLPYDKIETILHKESTVHGLIHLNDGVIKACMSPSDMRIPIQYAMFYPVHMPYHHEFKLEHMSFEPMSFERYPLLKLAYEVGEQGGLLPTVMNAANEAAVKLFLNKKIKFLDIERIVIKTVQSFQNDLYPTLQEIIETDQNIQEMIRFQYEGE